MLTRITYNNFGSTEHMFSDEPEADALELWKCIWGQGSVYIVSVGQAINTKDFGGYSPNPNL
ncbi:hypothetical protein [Paenibacillus periandrae]|uniref:hypothetical protein n=1 Tax=Paenibacillus periandrae TaxID=1761741 RepID=UPI001F09DC4E|nr:hypothetical protein [Paenibacillus periandrae]